MIELCGMPTNNGPCNMPKGHAVDWHRHRDYGGLTWMLFEPGGTEVIEQGTGVVGMNAAISACKGKHDVVHVTVKLNGSG